MRTTAFLIALVVAGVGGLSYVPAATAQSGGWTKLFNGKDLSNWNVTRNADWRVTDGVIEATKEYAPPPPVHNGRAYWVKVSAREDGTFTATNTRNGFSKEYR
jgi:hypothetical protein